MTEYEILKGRSRRLDRAIEKAEKQKNASLLVELIDIRDGAWANLYPTKKEAIATVDEWNQSFIDNGTHIFHNYLGA